MKHPHYNANPVAYSGVTIVPSAGAEHVASVHNVAVGICICVSFVFFLVALWALHRMKAQADADRLTRNMLMSMNKQSAERVISQGKIIEEFQAKAEHKAGLERVVAYYQAWISSRHPEHVVRQVIVQAHKNYLTPGEYR